MLHNRFLWWQGSAVKWTQIDVCLFSFHTLLCTHTCTGTQTETEVPYKRNLPDITKPLHKKFLTWCLISPFLWLAPDSCVSWDHQISRLKHFAIFPPLLINKQTEAVVNVTEYASVGLVVVVFWSVKPSGHVTTVCQSDMTCSVFQLVILERVKSSQGTWWSQ